MSKPRWRTSISIALLLAGPAAAATAQQPPSVVVELAGEVEPGLRTALVAELGASGFHATFTPSHAPSVGLSLQIHVGREGGLAVARRGDVVLGSAPLPPEPEAAALGASSLLFETPPAAPPPCAAAGGLDAPAAVVPYASAPLIPAEPEGPPAPNRGLVIEALATTALIANGGTLGVGHFFEDVLVRGSVTAVHLWANDSVAGMLGASVGYVHHVGVADFEASLELGVVGVDLTRQSQIGGSFGISGGVALAANELVAVVIRLGAAAAYVQENVVPSVLLSLGLRVSP